MTYKRTLFFVAQCLTISLEEKNRSLIEQKLQKGNIDWDKVVQLSTSHYVLPAMYCNLKRVDFLKYLPKELVSYMSHITQLNRERNLQIITQAREINQLLLTQNITPIFLKGTGNLLEDLYEDYSERMVGDIDIIIKKNQITKSKLILKKNGYKKGVVIFSGHRHESRLIKNSQIAALEIHRELIREKYTSEFNYDTIQKEIQIKNTTMVLSFEHQLALSIAASQINDYGYDFKNLSLRNAYDVFLLSKKVDAKKAISKFKSLKNPFNCFLASCYVVFGEVSSLKFEETRKTDQYLKIYMDLLSDYKKRNSRRKLIKIKRSVYSKFHKFYKVFTNREYLIWLLKKNKLKKDNKF